MNPVETVAVMAATLRMKGMKWETAIEESVRGLSMILYNEASMLETLKRVAEDSLKDQPMPPESKIIKPTLSLVKPN